MMQPRKRLRVITLGRTKFKIRRVKSAQKHAEKHCPKQAQYKHGIHGYVDFIKKEIVIEISDPITEASVLIGEIFHVLFPYIDDFYIHRAEEQVIKVLWRSGFRPF
jgi:hypothetical protein